MMLHGSVTAQLALGTTLSKRTIGVPLFTRTLTCSLFSVIIGAIAHVSSISGSFPTVAEKRILTRGARGLRVSSFPAAHLPDQRPEHHQNPYHRRVRLDSVEQWTFKSVALETAG